MERTTRSLATLVALLFSLACGQQRCPLGSQDVGVFSTWEGTDLNVAGIIDDDGLNIGRPLTITSTPSLSVLGNREVQVQLVQGPVINVFHRDRVLRVSENGRLLAAFWSTLEPPTILAELGLEYREADCFPTEEGDANVAQHLFYDADPDVEVYRRSRAEIGDLLIGNGTSHEFNAPNRPSHTVPSYVGFWMKLP